MDPTRLQQRLHSLHEKFITFSSRRRNQIFMLSFTTVVVTLTLSAIFRFTRSAHAALPPPRTTTNTTKAGLAWSNGNNIDMTQYESTAKVSWYYTWSSFNCYTNLEFVPMLWGPDKVDVFTSSINQTIAAGNIHAVLGMNEPQEKGQSNITPQQGAQMWMTYLEPLRSQGIRLGSPAPSSAPSGLSWLQSFLTACAGNCTVDFIALHWYDINATSFQLYLENFHDTFQRPIWVTEWACQNYNDANKQCTQDGVASFLNQTQSFMDATPWVERYAWYGAMENLGGVNQANAIMDKNGKINSLGEQYIGAQAPQTNSGESLPAALSPWSIIHLFTFLMIVMLVLR